MTARASTIRVADLASESECARIDAFVTAQADGTPFHLTGWLKAGAKGCGQTAHYLLAEGQDGAIIGALPLSEIRSPLFGAAMVSTGFGVDGGVLGEGVDALAEAAKNIAATVSAVAIICFTTSGSTARRIARERPSVPLLVLTPSQETARRLGLLWGTHAVHTRDVESFEDMVAKSKRMALRHGMAKAGDRVIVLAGVPFRTPGSTNVLHVVRIVGDELKGHHSQV